VLILRFLIGKACVRHHNLYSNLTTQKARTRKTAVAMVAHCGANMKVFVAGATSKLGLPNIVDEEAVAMNEWLTHAALALGAKAPFSILHWLLRLISPYMTTVFDTRLVVSNRKAKDKLHWWLQYPSYREGLREMATRLKVVVSLSAKMVVYISALNPERSISHGESNEHQKPNTGCYVSGRTVERHQARTLACTSGRSGRAHPFGS